MIKAFKKELPYKDYNEIRIINEETGEFQHYVQHKIIGFPFSNSYKTTVFEMGYESVKACLKELKHRNYLGQEIDYQEQLKSEKIGYINLGVERIKRAGRVNSKDFEDVINKLSRYGLNYCDAHNQIIAAYEYSIGIYE